MARSLMFNPNWPGGSVGTGTPPNTIYTQDTGPYTFFDIPSNTGNLAKSGYKWLGWAWSNNATTPAYTGGEQEMLFSINNSDEEDDVTLYAVWQIGNFTVIYNDNGATGGSVPVDSNLYVQNASVTVKANPNGLVKAGHNFLGWATTSNATTPTFTVTGSSVNPSNFSITSVVVTLYAVWQTTSTTHTLTYNGNGNAGGSVPSASSSYPINSTITVPGRGTLTRPNYAFLGWSTSSSATTAQYRAGKIFILSANTTLYAVWSSNNSGSGGQVVLVDQVVASQNNYLPVIGEDCVGQGFTGDGSLITQAKFKLARVGDVIGGGVCAAIFAHDGGGWGSNGKPVGGMPLAVSNTVDYLELNDESSGAGWVTFAFTGSNKFQTAVGGRYFVCLMGVGVCNYGGGGHVAVCGTEDSLVFNGGSAAEGGFNGTNYTWHSIVANLRLLFELFGEQFVTSSTVTYNANGATGGSVPVDNNVYAQGTLVTVAINPGSLVKSGHIFMGWSTSASPFSPFKVDLEDANGSITPPTFPMSTSNVTLHALWVILRTLTYNGNGNTGGAAPVDQLSPYPDGSLVTVLGQNTLVMTNRTFICWVLPSMELIGEGDTFVITENTVLYAGWIQGEPPTGQQYQVWYNKNDPSNDKVSGSVPIDYNVYPSGAKVTVLGNTGNLTRSEHVFLGWNTQPMALKAKYVANSTFNIPPNSVTLYAIWGSSGGGSSGSGSGQVFVGYNERYAGSGSKETPLVYNGNSSAVLCVESNLHDLDGSAIIENLVIDGANTATTGILLQNVANCLIRNVTIKNCEVGIRVKLTGNNACSWGNRFEHLLLENVNTGILFEGTETSKDYSYTIIDDVGIKLKNNSNNNVGVKIEATAKLYSAFVKTNVWLNGSNGKGLEVNGQLKLSLINLAVSESIQNNTGKCIVLNVGANISANQSFLLTVLGVNNNIANNGGAYSGIKIVP
ncbi:MAG: InlB B-repeat-containing protein [Candidatus Bathyarchaeota archaeon]|nr:InlB B-repeat-containing protein [Candidatus Termiticorpusculum sp.]